MPLKTLPAPWIGLAIVATLCIVFGTLFAYWIKISKPENPPPTIGPLSMVWVAGESVGRFEYEHHIKLDYWDEMTSQEWRVMYQPPQGPREFVSGFRTRAELESLRAHANTEQLTVTGHNIIHERPLVQLGPNALWDMYLLPFWKAFANTGIAFEERQTKLCDLQEFGSRQALFRCTSAQGNITVQLDRAGGATTWSTATVLDIQLPAQPAGE